MDAQKVDSFKLQERDVDVLRDLFVSRVMTGEHIAKLHFNGSREAAKKRLQKLKAAGLLGERARKVNEPAILFLTRKAFSVLQEKAVLSEYPPLKPSAFDKRTSVSDRTLAHELEVMDVKAAFHSAIRGTGQFTVAEFSTWPLLYQFKALRPMHGGKEVDVQPDGFIRIHEKEVGTKGFAHDLFLEVDRSQEVQGILFAKAACYMDYFRSGGFAEKNGVPRSEYKKFPFRVLMVLKNAQRRNNTAERLLQATPPILTQVWLSTFQEVIASPLAEIWTCPADYHDATKGTPFDVEQRRGTKIYRTQSERDVLVESRIKKRALLAA